MAFPGFRRRDSEVAADPAIVERRPGESTEAFETRLAVIAREREGVVEPTSVHEAYEAGAREQHRRDSRRTERPRRRGIGLAGVIVALVAVAGALWLALAAREGSFAAGGAVVDNKLAEVTAPARQAATQAVDRTGKAVQTAGQTLESQGEKIRETAK